MLVYWLEQTVSDVPDGDDWLSPREADQLRAMHFAKRRADWLLGRWTAKNAVALHLGVAPEPQALREIEIRSAPSGAPEIFLRNEPSFITISLSHRSGIGACAIASSRGLLGCDLEMIEPHGDAFAADYFTADEQELIAKTLETDRPRLVTLLWSCKESALKALHVGLRLDTRSVAVSLTDWPRPRRENVRASVDWNSMNVRSLNGQVFQGWWSQTDNLVRTVLSDPPAMPPVPLEQAECLTC